MTRRALPAGLLTLVLLASLPLAARAQADTTRTRLAFVEADTLIGLDLGGEPGQLLIGNVRVRQDSTLLRSHRALRRTTQQTFEFVGSVLIVERGDSLRADSVFYDRRTKIGRAHGNVYLTDGDVQVRAPSARYFTREKRARFEEGLTLTDSLAVVTSRRGTYWSDEKRADLEGDVRLEAERTTLDADSLTYFRETEISEARGHVFIARLGGEDDAEADSTIRTLLFGGEAYHDDQAGYSRVVRRPVLLQLRQDSTGAEVDTLVMRARRLEVFQTDSLRRLVAVDSVRIWKHDFAARADSVVYERLEIARDSLVADRLAVPEPVEEERYEETRLFGGPMAWVEEAQVTGDTIRVSGQEGAVDSLFVRQKAFIAQRDTLLDRINQLRGQHVVGVFEDDSTRTFYIGPNAEAIYFERDENDQADGGVRASGDRAVFVVKGEEPQILYFVEGTEGTFYPEHLLPTPFRLDGFLWRPERRPEKRALLDATWIRARLEAYAHPLPPEPPPEEAAPTSAEHQHRR